MIAATEARQARQVGSCRRAAEQRRAISKSGKRRARERNR